MHCQQLFHDLLKGASSFVHQYRFKSLMACAESVVNGALLTVTQLGKQMKGEARVKHKIKRVDRLLNNPRLYQEKVTFYKATTHRFLMGIKQLMIVVDWSPFQHTRNYGLLRATTVLQGRSITLYQEVFLYVDVMRLAPQTSFLKTLKFLLPPTCQQVIVITDMGFQSPWFRLVQQLGWDFIGRVRGDVKYSYDKKDWKKTATLQGSSHPKLFKNYYFYTSLPLQAHLVVYKKKRHTHQLFSSTPTIRQYQKVARTAWRLITSIPYEAKKVCGIYQKRMLIETSFRDVKSYRFGMGLNLSLQKTQSLMRREILLLIAHVAQCLLLIMGWLAYRKKWHLHFQVNSIKHKRIYSLVFLGQQVMYHYRKKIRKRDWTTALRSIFCSLQNAFNNLDLSFCGDN